MAEASPRAGPDLFPGFSDERARAGEVTLHVRRSGAGPPVLLLHGYPQTVAMWHRVAAPLARRFTVVVADLRGYGDSDKPPSAPDHAPYSKRAMAADALALMRGQGFERFAVVGHDRGGRVAHRLALDAPDAVSRLAVLDIAPTLDMYEQTTMEFARAYYHWFFFIQPEPLPERLIGADPVPAARGVARRRGRLRRGQAAAVRALPARGAAGGGRRRAGKVPRVTPAAISTAHARQRGRSP